MRGALRLDATNLMLSRHAEAVYNLGSRMSEVSVCADTPGTEQSPATGQEARMPAPFLSIYPYLEGALWLTVHFSLSAEIERLLAPKWHPGDLLLAAERFFIEDAERIA